MNLLKSETSVWREITRSAPLAGRYLVDRQGLVQFDGIDGRTILHDHLRTFREKSVLLYMAGQMTASLAMIELDGLARRLILCPPDMTMTKLVEAVAETAPDLLLTDDPGFAALPGLPMAYCSRSLCNVSKPAVRDVQSEWLLFTSGTTGRPKAVVHNLASLTAPLRQAAMTPNAVWSTFYDIRRYGGLTIFLRALLTAAPMMLSDAGETVTEFLRRASTCGVTHISGTPSHWRQAMMCGGIDHFRPEYIRLSGEPADQAVLDMLAAAFPTATISHAYASTEAGVAFDVRDGLAGFPAYLLGGNDAGLDLKVQEGTLHIRSERTAARYLREGLDLHDREGFIDTGDLVERREDRYFFTGRREGLINVGGYKVHPEEVEAVINRHPAVQVSLVKARKSPITGSLVVADVVLHAAYMGLEGARNEVMDEILAACRKLLPPYKVPGQLFEVASLPLTPAGKLSRTHV